MLQYCPQQCRSSHQWKDSSNKQALCVIQPLAFQFPHAQGNCGDSRLQVDDHCWRSVRSMASAPFRYTCKEWFVTRKLWVARKGKLMKKVKGAVHSPVSLPCTQLRKNRWAFPTEGFSSEAVILLLWWWVLRVLGWSSGGSIISSSTCICPVQWEWSHGQATAFTWRSHKDLAANPEENCACGYQPLETLHAVFCPAAVCLLCLLCLFFVNQASWHLHSKASLPLTLFIDGTPGVPHSQGTSPWEKSKAIPYMSQMLLNVLVSFPLDVFPNVGLPVKDDNIFLYLEKLPHHFPCCQFSFIAISILKL